MSTKGVSILDFAQPHRGYKVASAVATSYSADLLACLALLIGLDGGDTERINYSRIEALRALERLRGKLRIIVQQNRVEFPDVRTLKDGARILGLLDTVIRTVPFDGRERSFHPKTLLVKQCAKGEPDRYVLAVTSRNLTLSNAWDFGIGLVGYHYEKPARSTTRIAGLHSYVEGLGALISERDLSGPFSALDNVSWELPPGIRQIEFHHTAGEIRKFNETALARLPKNGRTLLISPFLTSGILTSLAKHFSGAEDLCLVSGKQALDKIAATASAQYFDANGGAIRPYSMATETDDAKWSAPHSEDDEEARKDRGLHAKIFCVSRNGSASAIIGSANLTSHAWTEKNWEAFVLLRGSDELASELWDWSQTWSQPYRPPVEPTNRTADDDPLDDLRNELAKCEFILTEKRDVPPTLRSDRVGALLQEHESTIEIARLTTPDATVTWTRGIQEVILSPCDESERTSLLLIRAVRKGIDKTWVQRATLIPEAGSNRDRQAFVRLLGLAGFLRYLRSLLSDFASPEQQDDYERTRLSSTNHLSAPKSDDPFELESLLRRLNRDPHALSELDDTIRRYRRSFEESIAAPEERKDFEQFCAVWAAISGGMEMQ